MILTCPRHTTLLLGMLILGTLFLPSGAVTAATQDIPPAVNGKIVPAIGEGIAASTTSGLVIGQRPVYDTGPMGSEYATGRSLPIRPPAGIEFPQTDPAMNIYPQQSPFFSAGHLSDQSQSLDLELEEMESITGAAVNKGPRNGVFQSIHFVSTFLPPTKNDDPRIVELEAYGYLAFPLPSRDSPLILSPGFAAHFFSASEPVDLPEEVFETYLQIRWLRKVGQRWGIDLSATPGVYSDFEDSEDGFRITAHGLISYDKSPLSKWVAGILFLHRNDVNYLPAGGWIWTPSDDTRLELLFPKPRLARRFRAVGCIEDWCYIAGEFGGDAWWVERGDGTHDFLYQRDYRLLFGVERKHFGLLHGHVEIGYVFGREFEYDSAPPTIELDPSILLRAGLRY